jgi:hypothetical protein
VTERDYDKEYKEYHASDEQKKRRAQRNAARRKLNLKKGDPREAGHVDAPRKGSLEKVPVRPISFKKNRADQPKRGS